MSAIRWRGLSGLGVAAVAAALSCRPACRDGCVGPDGARIDFDVPTGTPRAVLYDGLRDGICRRGLVCVNERTVYLGAGTRWGEQCPLERLVAFAPGFAPHEVLRRAAIPQAVRLPEVYAVPVAYWIVAASGDAGTAEAWMRHQVADADYVFRGLAAGLGLAEPSDNEVRSLALTSPEGQSLIAGCAARASIAANVATHRADAAVNVYFVPWEGREAVTCDAPYRDMIFISHKLRRTTATLAHELGHALGPPGWIHVEGLDGFRGRAAGNLMNGGVQDVTDITLGQVFRLQFDGTALLGSTLQSARNAWLGLPPGTPPLICQASAFQDDPCPPLAARPSGEWP